MVRRSSRPTRPGEFAGDRGGDDGAALFACGEATEPSTQPDLGGPGAGYDLGSEAFVAAVEFGTDPAFFDTGQQMRERGLGAGVVKGCSGVVKGCY